ncbi:MAG TPA: SDR family oxidoreductase, partial [Candidatus Acidoferrum sp.]|nr:SDR family oxidoreductase [Candidatus Acidoferrum sp.]
MRLVTGGTGFIGRHLLRLLARRDGDTFVLVRPASRERLEALIDSLGVRDSLRPVEGDITEPLLGLDAADQERLAGADVYHLAAVYDLEAPEDANERANVAGTRNVLELASRIGARVHHMSSIAVAGARWKGPFTEEMFAEGQDLDHPY